MTSLSRKLREQHLSFYTTTCTMQCQYSPSIELAPHTQKSLHAALDAPTHWPIKAKHIRLHSTKIWNFSAPHKPFLVYGVQAHGPRRILGLRGARCGVNRKMLLTQFTWHHCGWSFIGIDSPLIFLFSYQTVQMIRAYCFNLCTKEKRTQGFFITFKT